MGRIGIKQATQKGYIECGVPGVADFSYPKSKLRRGRVQGGGSVSPTITTTGGVCKIIEWKSVLKQWRLSTDNIPDGE